MLEMLLGSDTRSNNPLENPNVSLSDPAAYEYLGGGYTTDAGLTVSPKVAMRLPAIWQAVTMISGDVSVIPLDVFKKEPKLGRVVATEHPAQRLVHDRASKNVMSLDLWQTAMVHALIWNNAYIYIDRLKDGTPVGLYNMLPDRTAPEMHDGELYYVTETSRRNGDAWLRPIPAANVIHIKGISFDGVVALETVEHAKHSWATALAHQKFEAKFFKNGIRAGGVLELPATMGKPVQDKLEDGFKKQVGEDKWFTTVILRDGAKFHQQTIDPRAAQMSELANDKVRDVARWFNLAPSRLGVTDSTSYNSKSEDKQSYLDSTLNVWLQKIAGQCKMRLLTDSDQGQGMYFEHNTAAFLRMNIKDRFAAYSMGFGRWLNRNDICRFENMPDTGPDGDKYIPTPVVGNKTGGADKNGNEKPRGPAKRDRPQPEHNPETLAIRRTVFTLADHARKKSSNPKAFLEFVDGNLSFHRQRSANTPSAAAWIDRAHATLKALAESKSAPELESAVDAAMTELETACP